jgi:hypothetical protein
MRSKEGIDISIDEVVELFTTSADITSFYHIIF